MKSPLLVGFVFLGLSVSGCATYRYSIELEKIKTPIPVSASSSFILDGRTVDQTQYRVIEHFSFKRKVIYSLRKKPKVVPLEITEELNRNGADRGADAIVNLQIIPSPVNNKSERSAAGFKSVGSSFLLSGGGVLLLFAAIDWEMIKKPIGQGILLFGFGIPGGLLWGIGKAKELSAVTEYEFTIEGDAVKIK